MKKILTIVGISLPAFVLGFIGIYFAMPMLAPERVEETQHMLDSLRVQNSLAGIEDSTLVAMQYHAFGVITDSLNASLTRLDSSVHRSILQQEQTIAFLRDSLKMAHERLKSTLEETSKMKQVIDELNERLEAIEAKRVEARNLSSTLPKLDIGELSPILQNLELSVVEMVYTEATARNRTKILQALSSERAARFVRHLMTNDPDTPPPALPSEEPDPTKASTNPPSPVPTTANGPR